MSAALARPGRPAVRVLSPEDRVTSDEAGIAYVVMKKDGTTLVIPPEVQRRINNVVREKLMEGLAVYCRVKEDGLARTQPLPPPREQTWRADQARRMRWAWVGKAPALLARLARRGLLILVSGLVLVTGVRFAAEGAEWLAGNGWTGFFVMGLGLAMSMVLAWAVIAALRIPPEPDPDAGVRDKWGRA